MNVNALLLRRGKPYPGRVCYASPDTFKGVSRVGFYAVKLMEPGVPDRVRRFTPVVPDGGGGWLYG